MHRPVLDRAQSRRIDQLAIQEYGIPGVILMENAGRGVADTLEELGIAGPVVICCGKGNNAGDGFVVARHLDLRGHVVRVLIWADASELSGDAGINYRILRKTDIPLAHFSQVYEAGRLAQQLAGADWIVDALLGTGAKGEPRPPLDAVIDKLNAMACKKLAVDLPSGLDCDTGHAANHIFRADHTSTFVAPKIGFFQAGAERYTGQIHVQDIGAPRKLLEEVGSREWRVESD